MKIKDILAVLEAVAPPHLQESYDNAGLIVGHPEAEVTGVLVWLDSTEAVVEEALALGCNLVVAHHPIVFRGLKRFNGSSYVERTVMQAIRHDVALYAIHTNLDNVYYQGVNAKIAEKLGLGETRILSPRKGSPESRVLSPESAPDSGLRTQDSGLSTGAGMIGLLPQPMAETDFLHHVKSALQASCVRHTALRNKPVEKVAVCGGSGSFLLSEALRTGAHAFVTADFKYHEFFDAEGRLVIADIGHYESEQFTIELLFDIVREKFPTFALHCTKVNTNPVFYL